MDVNFSNRELEIINQSAIGLTKLQIATNLDLSAHTIDYHVRNILRKTDYPNLTAAVVKAIKCKHIQL